jgi:23S rRNA (pseudouridine1915-N3)-methyltransferase
MKLILAAVTNRKGKGKSSGAEMMLQEYVARATRYTTTELVGFESEGALLGYAEREPGRPAAQVVLLDSRGDDLTSEEFAERMRKMRDEGVQRVMYGIGPADGWSKGALARGYKTMSLGRMTLPHELARVVLAEQVYRALTILAGHPYHSGH